MRVYVIEGSGKGGMIHYDYHLCRALQRNGVDTTLVTSTAYELRNLEHNFKPVELLRLWDPRGSKSPRNPVLRIARRGIRAAQYVGEWLRLVMYLRREKPDVALFGEIRFAFEYYFLRMLKASGLKLAAVVHDVQKYDFRPGAKDLVHTDQSYLEQFSKIYGLFDALFVHDRSNYDAFVNIYPAVPVQRIHQITMGGNEMHLETKPDRTPQQMRQELRIQPGQKTVLFFGGVTRYKGVDVLIKAFPIVKQATGARLVIAGFPAKDIDPNELKQMAADLGIADHISWVLDYVPNERVVPLMEISDVVAYPYRTITQSAAIQVAFASGKPVVATCVGGLADIIEDGKNGLLVPPENPQALGEAIVRILQDPEAAKSMGDQAKLLAENKYSWRSIAGMFEAAFVQL
jgi:glycosyltransferase involved in cell wall biosynthesis